MSTNTSARRFGELLRLYRQAAGFSQQIGGNTGYIIHPDEILADNFTLLVLGRTNVPSPRILKEMENVFQRQATLKR